MRQTCQCRTGDIPSVRSKLRKPVETFRSWRIEAGGCYAVHLVGADVDAGLARLNAAIEQALV